MRTIHALAVCLSSLAWVAPAHGQELASSRNEGSHARSLVGIFEIQVDGQAPLRVRQPGIELGDGRIGFRGERTAPDGSWKVRWDYSADLDPRETASIKGSFTFRNATSQKSSLRLKMSLPIDPVIDNACVLGGSATIAVAFDGDGGTLEVPRGEACWIAQLDGRPLASMKKGPLVLTGVANSRAVTSARIGVGDIGVRGDGVGDGFGSQHQCRISGGETVTCTTHLVLQGEDADLRRRRDTRRPVSIGGGQTRLTINLSGKSVPGRRGQATSRNGKGTLTVRPAYISDV